MKKKEKGTKRKKGTKKEKRTKGEGREKKSLLLYVRSWLVDRSGSEVQCALTPVPHPPYIVLHGSSRLRLAR